MALTTNHPLNERVVWAFSRSVGNSAETAYTVSPCRGKVIKVGVVLHAAITTADGTVATTINGTAITGGSITITQSGSAAGSAFSATPTAANTVAEGDYISFPPTGASGTTVGAMFYAIIRQG